MQGEYVKVTEPLLWRQGNALPKAKDKQVSRIMTLCQVCGTIQKAGDTCTNCKAPVKVPEVN